MMLVGVCVGEGRKGEYVPCIKSMATDVCVDVDRIATSRVVVKRK